MDEGIIAGPVIEAPAAEDIAASCPETDVAANTGETADRWPDVAAWLPGENMWLYAVPVIVLLFLWLFYPVILVLICIILALWWLG